MARKGSWSELGLAKLESSGLNKEIAETLGMHEVVSAKQVHESFDARPAIVLPYLGFDKKPMSSHPKWPGFYRIRYLAPAEKAPSFGDVAEKKTKEIRYVQPPGSAVCAYFPATVNWYEIAEDPEYDLIITEGEFKAAAGCEMDFPTIGLGGVWSFRAVKDGHFFLPELEWFKWLRRTVFICFDSDYAQNPNICRAIMALSEELGERGALVKVILLPEVMEDGKTGLDDYFLEHDADDFKGLLEESTPIGIHRGLWRINQEIVYVENPGLIINESNGQKISVDNFKSHSRWATASTVEQKIGAKGDIISEKVPAAPAWIKWPMRRSVAGLTYAPGEGKITEDGLYNQWTGWGVKPKKGDVTPWLDLTKFLFGDMEKGILDYFYDWCAYPVQNPGAKMFVAVVIHGIFQGTGKTLVGYTLGEMYGDDNWKEITDEDLEETFWAENKQFILGDEVSGKDNRAFANKLKRLITGKDVNINIKFVPQFTLPNRMNFIFTSQHGDSFFLEDKDRRYLVIEVTDEPLDDKFYAAYKRWLWEDGGASHLMQWLLDRKISKDFNPNAHAPRTAAKDRMIQAGKGDVSMWIHDLIQYPDQTLRLGNMKHTRDLFTSKELLDLYAALNPNHKVSTNGMTRALTAGGAIQVDGGQPLRGPDGKMARYIAVRNISYWKKTKDRKKMEANINMTMVKA